MEYAPPPLVPAIERQNK